MSRGKYVWIIVVLLAAIGAFVIFSPPWTGLIDESSTRQRSTELMTASVGDMLDGYKKEHGRFPSMEEGLKVLYPKYSNSRELLDRWGHPFVYSPTAGGSRPFVLYSVGANGIDEKGRGDDIDYWTVKK